MTDRELFGLPVNYEQDTGLDQVTFEVPYELMKALLKSYGYSLAWEDYRQIKIHPTTKTRKTVGQCQFLFSVWMNDNLRPAIKPSIIQLAELGQMPVLPKHLGKSGRRFRHRN